MFSETAIRGASKDAKPEGSWSALAAAFKAHRLMSGLLREADARIAARRIALEESKAELARQNGGSYVHPEDQVRLNVGGEIVICMRGALTLFPGTWFEALFSGRWEDKLLRDSNGYIFLDVHPGCFKKIVEYHRRKKLAGPDGAVEFPDLDKDEEEQIFSRQLAFFGLDDVIAKIDEGIPGQSRRWPSRASLNGSVGDAPASEQWQTAQFTEFTPDVNRALTTEQAALIEAKAELVALEKSFEREEAFIECFATGETKDIVTFVCPTDADRPISTRLSTLTQVEESLLGAKFRESWTNEEVAADNPKLWDVEQVIDTVMKVKGMPSSIADRLREEEIGGEELMAMEMEGLKELGGTSLKLGARLLLLERIRELRQAATAAKTQLVEYSHYSFSKIIDQLRLRAICEGDDALPPPFVKKAERSDFKSLVEHYFPGDLAANFF